MNYSWKVDFVIFTWLWTFVEVRVETIYGPPQILDFYFLPWRTPDYAYSYIRKHVAFREFDIRQLAEREADYLELHNLPKLPRR